MRTLGLALPSAGNVEFALPARVREFARED